MRKTFTFLIALLVVVLHYGRALADESPSLAMVREAWKQRARDLNGNLLRWTEKRVYPKGEMISPHDREPLNSDLTIVWKKTLIISEDKCRIEGRGETLDSRTGKMDDFEFTAVVNGGGSSFHDYSDQEHDLGYFTKSFKGLADVTYRPAIFGTVCGRSEFNGIKLDDYHIVAGSTEINGRKCIKLESKVKRTLRGQLFVDPDRQFVITRVLSSNGDRVSRQMDLLYERDANGIWYPASWQFQIMNGNFDGFALLLSATTDKFDSRYVAADSDFEIEYPPGTQIYDMRTPGDTKTIVVRDDGSHRLLNPNE